MKRRKKIMVSQPSVREILPLIIFMLFVLIQLLNVQSIISRKITDEQILGQESADAAEIQNSEVHNFLPVKLTEGQQSVSELHRLDPLVLLFNRIITSDSFFENRFFQIFITRFVTDVPIFILGHALLN